jgi:protein N-terminal methyltransferase
MTNGFDGEGKEFTNLSEVWDSSDLDGWYGKAMEYWSNQDASINGVLGGFGDLHPIDLAGTELLLNQLNIPSNGIGADCGAGVGRITQFLLSKKLSQIDLIEPCSKLLEKAKEELPKTMKQNQIGSYICEPLQRWDPPTNKYHLMWHQWVLLYLTDSDCVAYLERCKRALAKGGFICIKENVALRGQFLVDNDDNSVTRTLEQYKDLFRRAGLEIVAQVRQGRWPTHLFPVLMWALVPV